MVQFIFTHGRAMMRAVQGEFLIIKPDNNCSATPFNEFSSQMYEECLYFLPVNIATDLVGKNTLEDLFMFFAHDSILQRCFKNTSFL